MNDQARPCSGAPVAKPWIEAIHPYEPGRSAGPDGRVLIKLSANENPLGTSSAALVAQAAAGAASVYPDPDSQALRTAIGRLHGIPADRIVMGTGSDELLNLAAQGYAGDGDEVLYVRYGYSVYDIAARRCGATPVVARDVDFGADVDLVLAHVTARTRVIFLANPNNPTGSFLARGEIARLHASLAPTILLVLDQAYAEYLPPEDADGGLALAMSAGNVLVTRTFSKIYGLAAQRAGWAAGAPGLIRTLNRIRSPFNVSGTAQAMARAALGDQAFVTRARLHNQAVRSRFTGALRRLSGKGVRPVPSFANFVLVLFEGRLTAEAAFGGLAERGYMVRWLPGQGLANALRFTIGTEQQMDAVAAALGEMAEAAQG